MDYIASMQKLKKYREDKRNITSNVCNYDTFVSKVKANITKGASINAQNLVEQTKNILVLAPGGKKTYLGENIEHMLKSLEVTYTDDMRKATVAYEKRMLEIHNIAKETIQKGSNKPVGQSASKVMGISMLGIFGIAMLASSAAVSSMGGVGESASTICIMGGLACILGIIAILSKKKKPDENKLTELAAEAKRLTVNYFNFISTFVEKAATKMTATKQTQLKEIEDEIKAELGERVFFLFENTPYRQQEYFISLGMTASSEDDFNNIALECLKADKAQQQIDLQNDINRETRDAINKGLADLNRTAKQMHEDAEFRARVQAQQNAEMMKQNERSIKNQAKTIDELKKQTSRAEDLEYRLRHMSDK